MKSLHMTINGQPVEAEEGMTVLDAAKKAGIEIPTLCHNPKLEPYGACRLCMVEVEQHGRKRNVASCAFPAKDGLAVITSTPKLERARKLILELLWPAYTTTAAAYGLTHSRFETGHPDCSLCGLCVRYCHEVAHKNAVYFQGRGVDRKLAFAPGMAHECESCRQCFNLCSSGWIVSRYAANASEEWNERTFLSGCSS